jgi:anti-sigma B factor antagonist
MPFNTKQQDDIVIIEIIGKFLGSIDGPAFKEELDKHKTAGVKKVIVDLEKTDLMDSTGIGTLIAGLTSMKNAGGDMRLANLKKRIRNIFLMTRLLGPVFDDYESLDGAIASYAP